MAPIITLLTDYGCADSYVAEMKAVLLTAVPSAQLVDITHDVPPGEVAAAQYLLSRSWHRFPSHTVHLAVVDPGVGTDRRAIAANAQGHHFVGPDNGVLTAVLDRARVVRLEAPAGASATFHGRDVFAPAAARLALGEVLETLGPPVPDPVLDPLPALRRQGAEVVGGVIYVDRFGTLVTNIDAELAANAESVEVKGTPVPMRRTFGEVAQGQPVAFVGSGGTVEIAVRDGSALERLQVGRGEEVRIYVLNAPTRSPRSQLPP